MYQAPPVKKQCNFCSREGLLIYPARYAVACPAGAAGVPGLSGNFTIGDAPPDIGAAKYTLRSLRPGYLYSYDEKRRRLKAYVVTPKGFLSNFPLRYLAPDLVKATFRCTAPGEITIAHCVDIAHTPQDPAGNLWLGWSSVMWTQALIDKINDAAWRKLHMQCIDVSAMLAGSAAHTGEFEKSHRQIAHFAVDAAAMKLAFDFSNNPTANEIFLHEWSGSMQQMMAAHAPHHKGYVVAVNDPVGITNDLSELTVPTLHNGFDEDAYRGMMVRDMLDAAERCVREAAREDVLFRDELDKNAANDPESDPVYAGIKVWEVIKAGGPGKLERKREADRKIYGTDQKGRQDAAADHAWEDVISEEVESPPRGGPRTTSRKMLLDQPRLNAFPTYYADALKNFAPKYNELARTHLSWLKSEQLANWLAGVHDPADIRSGYAYSESVAQCIGKAASSALCVDQLSNWLNSGQLSDIRNLYARALLFNQADLIAATEANLKGSDFKFKLLMTLYNASIKRVAAGEAARLIDRLALTTANVLVKALKISTQSVMRQLALSHLALIGGDIVLPSTATVSEFAAYLRQNVKLEDSAVKVSTKHFEAAIDIRAREAIKNSQPNSGLIGWQIDIQKLQAEGMLAPDAVKGVQIPGFKTSQQWLGSTVPSEFHRGTVVTIIQMVALIFVSQNLTKSDHFNVLEQQIKTVLAVSNLCTATIETISQVIIKHETIAHPLAAYLISQWSIEVNFAKKILTFARRVGMLSGILAGIYDIFVSFPAAINDKNKKLAVLYFASGSLGIAVAIAGYCAFALFWPLLLASFAISIAIAFFNRNALRKWVSRCYFGDESSALRTGASPYKYSYLTLHEELSAFNHAVGA